MTTTPPPGDAPGPAPGPEPDPAPGGTATATATAAATASEEGPRVTGEQVRDLGRLRRTTGPDRYVAGVAGGLARHLDVDPVLVRVGLVVLSFFGGAGLLLYAAAWLLVPEDGAVGAPFSLDERSRSVALVAVGVLAALALLGDAWGPGFFPWPLALLALVVYLLLRRRDQRRAARPPGAWGPPAPVPDPHPAEGAYPAPPASGGPTAYAAPPPPAPPAPPSPPDPRRRGPRLFAGTLAAAAFGIGLLSLADVAGAPVISSAYPALVLATIGALLVLGAFWGRAGGLIALGLLATLALVVSTAADRYDGERTVVTPQQASEVATSYDLGAGELVVDLTGVADPDALLGRTLEVDGEVGRIEVLVPEGLPVTGELRVHGPGAIRTFGSEEGGFDRSRALSPGADGSSALTLDLELEVGQIEVTTR
ncbi:PspC domain-containing protein [Nocardioides perillae]|uniref:Phage shock protein PspC (Stress-responsive transcriptional regulator) n=1 Tax=Nocardioides perillae TaxID=1119534 RepID=A0A7Y9RR69_9ACTN|nr:PspC domain-containing protein [Nocardioides perillae]NYG55072.1 phage shock protein PspC (stress-responsive transcriptional regulator) [Nocardioides perillae]